jgi:hypothetical protein
MTSTTEQGVSNGNQLESLHLRQLPLWRDLHLHDEVQLPQVVAARSTGRALARLSRASGQRATPPLTHGWVVRLDRDRHDDPGNPA